MGVGLAGGRVSLMGAELQFCRNVAADSVNMLRAVHLKTGKMANFMCISPLLSVCASYDQFSL